LAAKRRRRAGLGLAALLAWLLFAPAPACPAELPKSTQEILKKTGFDAAILAGLDGELALPPAWLEAARKEGELRIVATWDPRQFR